LQALERAIEAAWLEEYKTDFTFQNPGGTRIDHMPAGPICERDIWEMLPFNDTIAILTVDRRQLTQYFERSPAAGDGRTTFTLVTNNYAAKKAVKEAGIRPGQIHWLSDSWRQSVIDCAKRHGTLPAGKAAKRGKE